MAGAKKSASDDDGAGVDDRPPDNSNDEDETDFVEVDPTGRYGRYDEVLGKGAFKTVYRAFDEVDGIEVAWNQVRVQDVLQNPEDLERLYSEVHLLKTLKHKNIIKFYNSWVDPQSKNVNFITEIFTSGTLRQYRKKHKHVDMKAVKNWSRQILRGLLYLHSHDPPIIHRDLKCDNIFINGNQGEVKIGDLGLAAILRQAHAAHSVIGTPEFMAPELYEEEYNELVDIYSFGMCLLEMITFEYPYSECANAAQIYKKVTSGRKPAALGKIKDPQVYQFVEKCLASASERLPARELLMDPFLKYEGDLEVVECLPGAFRTLHNCDDLGDLGSIPEEPFMLSNLGEPRYGQKEILPGKGSGAVDKPKIPNSASTKKNENLVLVERKYKSSTFSPIEKPSRTSPNVKEEHFKRSRDFRVKGKRQNDKIWVRIRIADFKGGVRNIQFEFDVEADTAMSVASEMVAELDLSDQDVTTIAEMIDAEILALVPDWKPGVALDETVGDDENLPDQQHVDELPGMPWNPDSLSLGDSEGSVSELSWPGHKNPLEVSKTGDLETGSALRSEGLMYGRFEEVGFQSSGSNYMQHDSDAKGFFSDSSDGQEDTAELDPPVNPRTWTLPKETKILARVDSTFCSPLQQIAGTNSIATVQSGSTVAELVESMRQINSSGAGDGLVSFGMQILDQSSSEGSQKRNGVGYQTHGQNGSSTFAHSKWHFPSTVPKNLEGNDEEAVAQQLRLLVLQQEQEIQELRRKHEQAVLDLKTRLRRRDSSTDCLLGSKLLARDATESCGQESHGISISSNGSLTPMYPARENPGHHIEHGGSHISYLMDNSTSTDTATATVNVKATSADGIDSMTNSVPSSQHLLLDSVAKGSASNLGSLSIERQSEPQETSNAIARLAVFPGNALKSQGDVQSTDLHARSVAAEIIAEPIVISKDEPTAAILHHDNAEKPSAYDIQSAPDTLAAHNGVKCALQDHVHTQSELAKSERVSLGRRESYLELYKVGVLQKEKHTVSIAEGKSSDSISSGDFSGNPFNSKNCDSAQQQLKKEQLQKSIAELEAKTLEGLRQSKSGYLVSNIAKKPASGLVQSGQPGPSVALVKQHTASETTRA